MGRTANKPISRSASFKPLTCILPLCSTFSSIWGEYPSATQKLAIQNAADPGPCRSRILLWILPQQVTHFPCIPSSAPLANLRTSVALLLLVWVNAVNSFAHCWVHGSVLTDPRLSRKIRDACACARAEGHRYLWIDSCCLDKSSSAELSEAINAMYRWYEVAVVCYAYLSDVHSTRRQKNMVGEFFLSGTPADGPSKSCSHQTTSFSSPRAGNTLVRRQAWPASSTNGSVFPRSYSRSSNP